ncbi:MAG: LysR family transcriptional regulator [Chromatiales bacterium]|jgi:DNA-binding transcriptional LysR family regulator
MDISLLKTFLAVARSRHFGKAADSLFVTQAAVSARIKQLESTLGIQLFSRERNNIQLTAAGERLRRHAETIVTSWERARLDVALKAEFSQSLVVGATIDLWRIHVRGWLDQLWAQRDDLALRIELNKADMLARQVGDSLLDLAFVYEPPAVSGLTARQLNRVPLVLVSSDAQATVETAIQDDYLLVDWGASFAVAHAALVEERATPRIHCSSGVVALDLLMSRGGSCYLAKPMVETQLADGQLHLVPEAPVIERHCYAIFRSDAESSELIQGLLPLL